MTRHITHAQKMVVSGEIMIEHGVMIAEGAPTGTFVQVVRVSIKNHYIELAFTHKGIMVFKS